MAPFASPAWVEELDRCLATVVLTPAAGGDDDRVVVQYLVSDGPAGSGSYALLLGPAGVRAQQGKHPTPTVTFTQSYVVAVAIARGLRPAQTAVLDGEVVVEGDVVRLLPWRATLAEMDSALGALRTRTSY